MSVIDIGPYFDRRKQVGRINSPPRQREPEAARPGSLVLHDDGLGNRTVELGGRWDADESDLEHVLLQLLLKLYKRRSYR